MFDPQDTSRPPLSDPRRGSATDRADLDDERGWWKSPPAGGSARCEAPVDVLHRTPSFYRQGYRVGKQWYSALRSSVSLGRLDGTGAGGLLIAQRGAQAALQGLLPHARESAAPALRRIAQRCAFRAFAAWWATTRKSTSTPASGPPKAVGPLRQARSERRHRRDEASGQPDPRRGEIDGPAGSGGVIVEKLDQVEQRALGVDDETDYVEEVFDPGDYDEMDDAM
jgi:hypothetical protein